MALSRLPFFDVVVEGDSPAVFWNGKPYLDYAALLNRVAELRSQLKSPDKQLVAVCADVTPDMPAWLIAILSESHAAILIDGKAPEREKCTTIERFGADLRIDLNGTDIQVTKCQPTRTAQINPELALLLATSGSTGSARYVRLGRNGLLDNAMAIAEVLDIHAPDVACMHLAVHYSYGLSVMTSHLARGAALSISEGGYMDRSFWQANREAGISHLPNVPAQLAMLTRLRLDRVLPETVRVLTQAGGRCEPSVLTTTHDAMSQRESGRFYVMYGQTEASPRMTTLAHEDFAVRSGSVGLPLPGCRVEIVDDKGETLPTGKTGEVVFFGSNVMHGMAETADDLTLADEQCGRLSTGDVGHLDSDGFLYITGRRSRLAKVHGVRVNLDDIERILDPLRRSYVVDLDDSIGVAITVESPATEPDIEQTLASAGQLLAEKVRLPTRTWKLQVIEQVPLTSRGKTDYQSLIREFDA